jgi:hypothetical protein
MRKATVPATARLEVDGGTNGGISIKGANRCDVLVRSKIEANADSQSGSRQIVSATRVENSGARSCHGALGHTQFEALNGGITLKHLA